MIRIKHWLLFGENLLDSTFLNKLLNGSVPDELDHLRGKKGVLFSTGTLERFIKEEALHDDHSLALDRSIQTYSSGEQRKALLDYLIASKPDFLVLDHVYDMLDAQSVSFLQERLSSLSRQIPVLQLFHRKSNVLPFIKQALRIEKERVVFSGSLIEYEQKFPEKQLPDFAGDLPPAPGELMISDSSLVQFKDVSVQYGDRIILRNINWHIKANDFWQLKGPNGAGKTTLLTMITGDNPKAYGQNITLFGRKRGSGESIWDIKKKIGYVTPAMTTLFRGWNTVEKMIISGLVDSVGLYKMPTEMQKQLAQQWLQLLNMDHLKHTRFATLSEGEQCMVMIARAMIKHPPLLILDEPTHGLDDPSVLLVSALVNKIAQEGNTAVIYVSHRREPGLQPRQAYELIPPESGSTGIELDSGS